MLWIMLGQIVAALGTFAGVRVLTELMTPGEYGKVALVLSLVNLVQLSLGRAFGTASYRFLGVSQDKGELGAFGAVTLRWSAGSIAMLLVFLPLLLLLRLGLDWPVSVPLLAGGVGLTAFLLLHALGTGIENAARHRPAAAIGQMGYEWGRVLLAALLVAVVTPSAEMAVVGFMASAVLATAFHGFFIRKWLAFPEIHLFQDVRETYVGKHYAGYLLPVVAGGFLTWIFLFSVRWILMRFESLEDVAVFSAFYQIGVVPSLLGASVLNSLLAPIFYRRVSDGQDKATHARMFRVNLAVAAGILAVVVAGTLAVAIMRGWICALLLDEAYRTHAWMLPWMVVAGGLYAVGEQLLISVMSFSSTKILIPLKAVMAGLAVAVYWYAAGRFGLNGVVFALAVLGGGYALLMFFAWLGMYLKSFGLAGER